MIYEIEATYTSVVVSNKKLKYTRRYLTTNGTEPEVSCFPI